MVFLGLLIGTHQGNAPKKVQDKTRRAAWSVFGAFSLNLASVAAALLWLVIPGGDLLYWITVGLFSTALISIVGVAAFSTYRLLR